MENEQELRTWHQTFDFESLMFEARKHITALAGQVWSDHNASDPGITQLEVLAFCIADLSYRTSFDVKDIIAGYKGEKQLPIDLPLADVALPNSPVNIKDLRKVLIDMKHPDQWTNPDSPNNLLIRNAFPVIWEDSEVPFYAVKRKGREARLMFDPEVRALPELNSNSGTGTLNADSIAPIFDNPFDAIPDRLATKNDFVERIILNGLYNLQIEFEDDREKVMNTAGDLEDLPTHLKDLNQNYFEETITVRGQEFVVSVLFPYWDDILWTLKNVDLSTATIEYKKRGTTTEDYFIAVDKLNYDDYFYDYYAEILVDGHLVTANIKIVTRIASTVTALGKDYDFTVNFLDWNELSNGVKRDYNLPGAYNLTQLNVDATQLIKVTDVSLDNDALVYDVQARFSFDKLDGTGAFVTTKFVNLLTRIEFAEGTIINQSDTTAVMLAIKAQFADLMNFKIELETEIYSLMLRNTAILYESYLDKLNKVFSLLYEEHGVWSYLGNYRNECEYFAKLTASRIQEIALFGKLIVAPNYNVNELLAEIYFRVDEFLNPLVKFNSLSEMTDKGYAFTELFKGPLLRHGFIEDEDLDNLKRRSVVYTSDLIRIIMDVEGVEAVEDFSISSYIDNRLMGRNVINCLSLTNSEIYKPRFSAEKTGMSVCVNGELEASDYAVVESLYKAKLEEQKEGQITDEDSVQLQLPLGGDQEIERYYSIQHDFPDVYGIGEYGLPIDANNERKARAKQLKAFLLPIEQLLANYLKQVAHLPELFSYNRTIDKTYSYQPLYEVPDVQPLFEEFVQSSSSWDAFKSDPSNSYQLAMEEGESEENFRDRRNRFLNQMLARFGETFEAYARQMFDRHKHLLNDPATIGDYLTKRNETMDKLISDKISFAEDYPLVTGERYKAFNTTIYDDPILWNNDNVASYKRRLCRLLGIETINNQFLFGAGTDTSGNPIDIEGMHIVEHILLRPYTSTDGLMPITNREDENGDSFTYDSDLDPYSFTITIVLPKNAGRFKEAAFREFTERLIRYETPAHIVVCFKWMNTLCGTKFEEVYSVWKSNQAYIKPYFFQNIDQLSDDELQAHLDALSDNTNTPNGANQLHINTSLIHALNQECKLEIKLYNSDTKLFYPSSDNTISFAEGTSDVFNVSVSETGGVLTIYKMDKSTGEWNDVDQWKPIEDVFFPVEDFLGDPSKGVTETFGGVGRYKLQYEIADENIDPVWVIVDVTPARIPVLISIGVNDVLLSFDTETDGVFLVKNKEWQEHFLLVQPNHEAGQLMIEPAGGTPVPLEVNPKSDKKMFRDIYDKFGKGQHRITYELNGENTFAEIEFQLKLAIHVFGKDDEYTPSDSSGIISIPTNDPVIVVKGVPVGGKLTVFDLDADVSGVSGVKATKETTASTTIQPTKATKTAEPLKDASAYAQAIPRDEFTNPSNLILEVDNVTEVKIDRNKDDRWKDGHRYHFFYELDGESIDVIVVFEAGAIGVPEPYIKFFQNDKELKPPYVFNLDKPEIKYEVEYHPKGAALNTWVINKDGDTVDLDYLVVQKDNLRETLDIKELYEKHGSGPFGGKITNVAGEFTTGFELVKSDPVIPFINILEGGVPMINDPLVLSPTQDNFEIEVNAAGGLLVIYTPEGENALERKIEKDEDLLTKIPLNELLKYSEYNPYKVSYKLEGVEAERDFEIYRELVVSSPPQPATVEIVDQKTGSLIPLVDDVYTLLLYPENKLDAVVFQFDRFPGILSVESNNGDAWEREIPEGTVVLTTEELNPGTYEAIYTSPDKLKTAFQFEVIYVVIQEPLIFELADMITGEELLFGNDMYTYTFDDPTQDQGLEIYTNKYPGVLTLTNEKGEALVHDVAEESTYLGKADLPGGIYKGNYVVSEEFFFGFDLKITHQGPEPATIEIKDQKSGEIIPPTNGVYELEFETNSDDQIIEFNFDKFPGILELTGSNGAQISRDVPEGISQFSSVELPVGEYTGTYISFDDVKTVFQLRVTTSTPLDASFILTNVNAEDPIYFAIGEPRIPKSDAYVWRVEGEFLSRKRNPDLRFNFSKADRFIVSLAINVDGDKATYDYEITKQVLQDILNEK